MADSAAFRCRVSMQTTGSPARARPSYSHCDSAPASRPIRTKLRSVAARKAATAVGSLGALPSFTTVPASSTMQMLVSASETSNAA
jgi:hypothetical protein